MMRMTPNRWGALGLAIGTAWILAAALLPAQTAKITISPKTATIEVGQTKTLSRTVTVAWSSSDTTIATVTQVGVVTGRKPGTATISVSAGGNLVATSIVTITPPPVTVPGTVSDLVLVSTTSTSATLSFTQVTGGAGAPASYNARYATPPPIAWGSASSVASGTCTTPIAGTAIGGRLTCTVLGLSPSTTYAFQVIAFRGTLNLSAVFGGLSNVVTATTPQTPIASITVTFAAPFLYPGQTTKVYATARDAAGNVLTGRKIAFISSNTSVLRVLPTAFAYAAAWPGR